MSKIGDYAFFESRSTRSIFYKCKSYVIWISEDINKDKISERDSLDMSILELDNFDSPLCYFDKLGVPISKMITGNAAINME